MLHGRKCPNDMNMRPSASSIRRFDLPRSRTPTRSGGRPVSGGDRPTRGTRGCSRGARGGADTRSRRGSRRPRRDHRVGARHRPGAGTSRGLPGRPRRRVLHGHPAGTRNAARRRPGVTVVSVTTVAPEHPWPAAPDDVEAALLWAMDEVGTGFDRVVIEDRRREPLAAAAIGCAIAVSVHPSAARCSPSVPSI